MEILVTGHDQFDRSMKKRSTEIEINHQTLISILPEHVILDHILHRISVKSLIRFKSVCKLWNSIISSSEFVETQLKFSSLCPQFVVLSEDYCSDDEHFKLFLLPCGGNNNNNNNVRELIRLDLDHNWDFTILDIVGSCNGLLCLYLEVEKKYGHFRVWNPVTRQCREIRNPDGEDFALDYGFGYVSSTDDYKIAVLFSARNVGFGGFYVFSLRSEEWKRIDGLDNVTIVINDTLYWALNHMKDWQMVKCIVGLDLVDEKLKEIPWMNLFNQYSRVDFFVMRERVSLHCCGDQGSDVWALKRYGEWSSWEKLFSVKLGGMSFLNFTETGKCLVKSSDQLKVVDPSQGAPEESQAGAPFSGRISGTAVYVESFISPFVPRLDSKSGLSKSIRTHDLRIG